jgi:hypothetical protein
MAAPSSGYLQYVWLQDVGTLTDICLYIEYIEAVFTIAGIRTKTVLTALTDAGNTLGQIIAGFAMRTGTGGRRFF